MKYIYRIRITDDFFQITHKEIFAATLPAAKKVLKRILEEENLDNKTKREIINSFEFWKSQILLGRGNKYFQTSKYNKNKDEYINLEISEEILYTK